MAHGVRVSELHQSVSSLSLCCLEEDGTGAMCGGCQHGSQRVSELFVFAGREEWSQGKKCKRRIGLGMRRIVNLMS